MRPIKALLTTDPMFLQTVNQYPNLVDLKLGSDQVSVNEKYIIYSNTWDVYKMTKGRLPRLCGRFNSLHRAVFRARLCV
jgi:hypothetical protein